MELSNALTLATLLNRTLILPPVRLGKAVPWDTKQNLESKIIADEELQRDCQHNPVGIDCALVSKWRYVSWEFLLGQEWWENENLIEKFNSSRSWLTEELGIHDDQIHNFNDLARRYTQIGDTAGTIKSLGSFQNLITLTELTNSTYQSKKLLHFGSLFSAGRLKLQLKENKELKASNEKIILKNAKLAKMSEAISEKLNELGGKTRYIGLHARVSDSNFKVSSFFFLRSPKLISYPLARCQDQYAEIIPIDNGSTPDTTSNFEFLFEK